MTNSIDDKFIATCPIPGCGYKFRLTIQGWDKHVGAPTSHPNWHPEIQDRQKRKTLFKKAFPQFMRLGLTHRNTPEGRRDFKAQQRAQMRKGSADTDQRKTVGVILSGGGPTPSQAPQTCPTCGGPVAVRYTSLQTEPMEAKNGLQIRENES